MNPLAPVVVTTSVVAVPLQSVKFTKALVCPAMIVPETLAGGVMQSVI